MFHPVAICSHGMPCKCWEMALSPAADLQWFLMFQATWSMACAKHRKMIWGTACVLFFGTVVHCFSVLVFCVFCKVPLEPNFPTIWWHCLLKKLVSFPIDFQTSFVTTSESQNILDWALAYTRRSTSKTHVFHFWPHFGCILASKMDAKSSQNACKNPIKN